MPDATSSYLPWKPFHCQYHAEAAEPNTSMATSAAQVIAKVFFMLSSFSGLGFARKYLPVTPRHRLHLAEPCHSQSTIHACIKAPVDRQP
jgi:hypothetical protein